MSWKLLQETEFTGTLRWIKSYDATIQKVDVPKFSDCQRIFMMQNQYEPVISLNTEKGTALEV